MLWHKVTQDLKLQAEAWSQSWSHTNMKEKSAVTEEICVNIKVGYLSFASWEMT